MGGGSISLPRALGRSLSLAADAMWGLGLATELAADDILSAERAVPRVPDDELLILLDGPDGRKALVALDRQIVTGLVEVQTLGKVTTFPLDSRRFTPTDAAMVAPLFDAALPRLSSMLVGTPELAHISGYAFGMQVDDAQTAALAFDSNAYRNVVVAASLASGTRQGRVTFFFPEPEPQQNADAAAKDGKYEALFKTVPAPMHAILTRIHLPLVRAQALRPGDSLEISTNAVGAATLVGQSGHIVTRGKLGQMNGFRALRIGDAPPMAQLSKITQDLGGEPSAPKDREAEAQNIILTDDPTPAAAEEEVVNVALDAPQD